MSDPSAVSMPSAAPQVPDSSRPPLGFTLRRPALSQTLGEGLSGLWAPSLIASWPSLAREQRGAGPVMVLPGLGADDASTVPVRNLLRRLGHRPSGWGLGRNRGRVEELLDQVRDLIVRFADTEGEAVAVVGQSLGGYLAREAARDLPQVVRRVVTFGSPVVGGPRYSTAAPLYALRGTNFDAIDQAIEEREEIPLRVPVTAIYSKNDGIVSWQACIDHKTDPELIEHVEVRSTHLAMGFDPEVLRVVARRLSDTRR